MSPSLVRFRAFAIPRFFFGFLIALTGLGLGACERQAEPVDLSGLPPISADLAKHFLVLYEGAPLPRAIPSEEARKIVSGMKIEEKGEYLGRTDGEYRLLPYFEADLDGDGVRDWTYMSNIQLFFPTDDDFDNDGIPNVLDAHPYDGLSGRGTSTSDLDGDGIADHLDWDVDGDGVPERPGIEPGLVRYQDLLHRDAGVIAVNAGESHTTASLEAMYLAATKIFAPVLSANGGRFPGWKYLLASQAEGPLGHIAWYYGPLQAIALGTRYRTEEEAIRFRAVATAVHELAHVLEEYLDREFDPAPVKELLGQFWSDGRFRSKDFETWRIQIVNTHIMGGQKRPHLARNFAKDNGLISLYALTNPREYFADSVVAYYYQVLIDRMTERMSGADRHQRVADLNDRIEKEGKVRPENLLPQVDEFLEHYLALRSRMEWVEICVEGALTPVGDVRMNPF